MTARVPPKRCDTARRREVIAQSIALGVPRDYGRVRRMTAVREPAQLSFIGIDVHDRPQWLATRAARAFVRMREQAQRDAVVLDVRTKPEYATGHIPGSRNIPYADLTERMREIEKLKSRPIIVCSESGARSSKVSGALKKIGLSDIFVLRGNLTGWAEASLPLEK